MKRVGILTVHRSLNYGAVLQAYALNRVLINNGYDSQIIDYICDAVKKREHKNSFTPKEVLKRVVRFDKYLLCRKKEKKFQDFIDRNYVMSNRTYNKSNIKIAESQYDYFITGSDQIWNYDITDSDTVFMLDFVEDSTKKKSYAASFGYSELPECYREKTLKMLADYSSLLVREDSGVEILNRIGLSGKSVMDPTLLLDREQWLELATPYSDEKYILIYTVAAPTFLYDAAVKLAKQINAKIKVIKLEPDKSQPGMEQVYDAGPRDFISLIYNAECIFTTSFHGLVFSLNFGKEVYFEADELKNKNTTRLTHIAKILGVMNRRISSGSVSLFDENPINWQFVNEKLEQERARSMTLLLNSLKDNK